MGNLREIQALKRLNPHPNIIDLEEVLYDETSGRLAMVFELMEQNLCDMISGELVSRVTRFFSNYQHFPRVLPHVFDFPFLDTFSTGRRDRLDQDLIKRMAHQIFTAISHMHSRGIIHRDIKPENILVDATGEHIKVADLGSCRSMTNSKQPMTEYIATRWYRSPECLLTDGHYGPEMDIWGAGCVVFEITALFPLFPGADEIDQINCIHKVIGTPTPSVLLKLQAKGSSRINYNFPSQRGVGIKHLIPHAPQEEVDLLKQTLIYDYNDRIKAHQALKSPYFKSLNKKREIIPVHSPTRVQSTTNMNLVKSC